MLKDYKNIIIFAVVALVAIGGVSLYLFKIKEAARQEDLQAIPGVSPVEVIYNLTGIITEKGENWITVEDKTPKPPTSVSGNAAPVLIKVMVGPKSNIVKNDKTINFQTMEVGNYLLMKTSKIEENKNEVTASDINILF